MPGPFPFDQILAADPNNPSMVAANGTILVFAPGDPTKTPLVLWDLSHTLQIANPVKVSSLGYGPPFVHDTLDQVAWEGGGFTGLWASYRGMKDASVASATAAKDSAIAAEGSLSMAQEAAANAATGAAGALAGAVAAAETARAAAEAAAALVGAPADVTTAALVGNPATLTGAALNATYVTFINITDPRIGGVGDGVTDNTAAFNSAMAILAVAGGTLFFPPGVYIINGSTSPVPGGVWLTGTGYDYHTPSSPADKPRLMSVIRSGAAMVRLIQLGTDASISTSGATGATIRDLVVDGNNLAQTTVKSSGRRNRVLDSQVYFGTVNALWIAGQNTHVVGSVIAQDNTGDVVLIKGFYDNKIWDCQIRQPGATGAAIHLHGDGANQTDIQRNHIWAGANAVAAPAKALIWLEATAANGVTNTLIQDNTIEGVLGPEILLDGVAGSAGIRGVDISGNRFYQNDNMPNDDTYSVVEIAGASVSSITVTGNVINGRASNFRYKSIMNIQAGVTSTTRIVLGCNVGLYVGRVLSGIVPPNRIHQYGNKIHNGTANVASDNNNVAQWSGDGTQKWVIWAHGLAGIPTTVTVTPGSIDATGPFFVEFDITNITVKYTTAPPAGTNNVKLNWFASL